MQQLALDETMVGYLSVSRFLLALGAVGFILDYRVHRKSLPLILLAIGAVLLHVGRYVFLSTLGA